MATLYTFPNEGLAYIRENVTFAEEVARSDKFDEPHVIVHFIGGDFVAFPPGLTIHEIFP